MHIIELKSRRQLCCHDEPMSERCTDRLHNNQCPGAKKGVCSSSKLDRAKHNDQLPKFFAAQH